MPKIIYVPQGRSARLTKEQMLHYDIYGLFTDEFSSCNIIAGISKDKLILMHIDTNTLHSAKMFEQIQREIEWIGVKNEIIVVFRDVEGGGTHVNKTLLAKFALHMPLIRVIKKEIDGHTHGLCLSFGTAQPSNIHPNMQTFPSDVRPKELIHHPQERQFLAVQKIEQVIGQEEKFLTGLEKKKQRCLFDDGWAILKETELKIDVSHPITRTEMQLFSKNDAYIEIVQLLRALMKNSPVPYRGDKDTAAVFMVPYFEDYINNYNYALLFKRNLRYTVNTERYKPQSNNDKSFRQAIIKLCEKPEDIFDKVKELVERYKIEAPESEFKEFILDGYTCFSGHYKSRKYYDDLKKIRSEILEEAVAHNSEAMQNYKLKNYELATNFFLQVIRIYIYCRLKNEPNLATAYYNCGQSLGKNGDYVSATVFIQKSLELRENYIQPKPAKEEIERTRKVLEEYQAKLEKPNVDVVQSQEMLNLSKDKTMGPIWQQASLELNVSLKQKEVEEEITKLKLGI